MDASFRIAIVEDHKALREVFVDCLEANGFEVFGAACAEDLDDFFVREHADLLILDINLPGEDGLSIGKRYRNAYLAISIIFLTVRSDAKDKILGYESGADLYLPKPVSAEELNAAVMSIYRRVKDSVNVKAHPALHIQTRELSHQRFTLSLAPQESKVLKGLIEALDNTLEYWQILELMDKEVTETNKKSLAVFMYRLNKKLEEVDIKNSPIKSVWKTGYQLNVKIVIV